MKMSAAYPKKFGQSILQKHIAYMKVTWTIVDGSLTQVPKCYMWYTDYILMVMEIMLLEYRPNSSPAHDSA